jgi:transcriptional regulator with AAA-type ATPase domain
MKRDQKNAIRMISELANTNPFSIHRFKMEKKILGDKFSPEPSIAWNRRSEDPAGDDRANVILISKLAFETVEEILSTPKTEQRIDPALKQEYWDVATYILLYRHITPISYRDLWGKSKRQGKLVAEAWRKFHEDYCKIFDVDGLYPLDAKSSAHLFACLAQVHRAFFHIFDYILGESLPVTRLREKVWESIFSCHLGRYHRSLFNRMRDLSTLVTGPSGTGKELVARAIGLSQYIPFDPKTEQFVGDHEKAFFPLNLSALSPTLIESELFGHCKGSFTGAVENRTGWLESCCPHGAVFLDEIGELDCAMQVKLLRVVQQRTYTRLGENKERKFHGKIVSATNRDLFEEINEGRFREDFYFRLCSDRILTPTLREQLDDSPADLRWLAAAIAAKLTGDEDSQDLADDVTEWIETNLGADYPWSGNIRELEQCVSSYMLRREYVPARSLRKTHGNGNSKLDSPVASWLDSVAAGTVTADELLKKYCTHVYAKIGSYEKTAAVLKIDRRTVKAKIDLELLESLKGG